MKTCIRGKQTHYKCRKMKLWSVTIKCRIGCLQRQWVLYVWIISPIIIQKHLIASKWTQRVLFLTAVMSFAYLISLLFPLLMYVSMSVCLSVCVCVCMFVPTYRSYFSTNFQVWYMVERVLAQFRVLYASFDELYRVV